MKKLLTVACFALIFALTGCISGVKNAALDDDATAASGWNVGDKVAEGVNNCFLVEGWSSCGMYRVFLGATQDGRYLVQDFYEQDNVKMTNPYFLLRKEEVIVPDFSSFRLQVSGPYTKWHPNGYKWYEGVFTDGKMTDIWTLWHGNGQKSGEGNIEDRLEQGVWNYWYENGQKKMQGAYVNSEQTGLWTQWYENGQKKSEANFLDGKLNGLWVEWYDNGVKQAEGLFEMDQPVGVWREWDMTGTLTKEESRDPK